MVRFRSAAVAACLAIVAACSSGSDSVVEPPPPPPPKPIASIAVTPTTADVLVGRTTQLTATPKDANGAALTGRTLAWTTSDASKATVDGNGLVTGVAAGQAKVTVTGEGKSTEVTVNVSVVPVSSVAIAPENHELDVGANVQLAATLRDAQNNVLTGRAIAWASDAPGVATVDANGKVTAVAAGSAAISATSEGKVGRATIQVRAPQIPVAQVAVAAARDTIEAYDELQLQAVLRDAQGNVLVGRPIAWSSSDPAVATINAATGLVTGVDRGTATFTATSEGKSATAKVVVVIKYRSVAAGTAHACDIASGGIVWCWGYNAGQGRVGSNDPNPEGSSANPVRLQTNERFVQLAAYGRTTCGLTAAGKAFCWGYNGWGNFGNGGSQNSHVPVAVSGNHTFRQITAGGEHICAVTLTNQAFCWGNNESRQLGKATTGHADTPQPVAGNLQWARLEGGSSHTCGVTTDNKTYCWGANSHGQIGDGKRIPYGNAVIPELTLVVGNQTFDRLALGQTTSCALTVNGQVHCWGYNGGLFGDSNGGDSSTPKAANGGHTFTSLELGFGHACAIKANNEMWCWGAGRMGQLGFAAVNGVTVPTRSTNLLFSEAALAGISTGSGSFTCAISKDRLTTYCFGLNDRGQLGRGTTSDQHTPHPDPVNVVGQKPLPVAP